MTKQQREAITYIESQLECGYLDLGAHEECEIEIIKEAINMWKTIDELNSIGCTSFQMTADELKKVLEEQEKKEIILDERITNDFWSPDFGKPLKITWKGE